MQPYTKKQIEELKKKFPSLLNFDSLYKNYRNKPLQLEAKVISALVEEREVTLEQFLTLIEPKSTIRKQLEDIRKEPYSSNSPLKLALVELENEKSQFVNDELFENRDLIATIREDWWK